MKPQNYYVYCDESCHLPYDISNVMVLGALYFPIEYKKRISQDIRAIKQKHGLDSRIEVKWTKVSNSKRNLFLNLINYFFETDFIYYRAIVAKNKYTLNHSLYNLNDWHLWYYKMYFLLLDKICNPENTYRIFVDVKDTRGGARINKLQEVLCNNIYDFKNEVIIDINQISSTRSDFLQLTDLLTGALSFYHRGLFHNSDGSKAKKAIIEKIIENIGNEKIDQGTFLSEKKINLFIWTPKGVR